MRQPMKSEYTVRIGYHMTYYRDSILQAETPEEACAKAMSGNISEREEDNTSYWEEFDVFDDTGPCFVLDLSCEEVPIDIPLEYDEKNVLFPLEQEVA